MNVQSIAFDLAAARKAARLSQRSVADAMGTTQSSVARVESGRTLPTIDFLDRYARAIGTVLVLELGVEPAVPSRRVRADRVRRVLRGYTFNPWLRDPTPAEQRSLEARGLTREHFESKAPSG